MPSADEILALRSLLMKHSVRQGQVTLASGETSDIYVDAKLTTLLARAMPLVGRIFLEKIQEQGWTPEAVGGLTAGADPIAMAIAHESHAGEVGEINAFIVRKEPKKHGMQRHIEGIDEPAGLRVVIIDDVCSTGGSTAQAIRKCLDAGMQILGALCLVDREMGATELLLREFGCTLHSVFRLSDLRSESNAPAQAPAFIETAL